MLIKLIFYFCYNYSVDFGDASLTEDFYEKFHQNEYKVTIERSEIFYVNKSLAEVTLVGFPYNRTIRANNITFLLYHEYNRNDLKVEFQAYKFLSNEYRSFPVHFQMDLCKALEENRGGTGSAFKCGNLKSCPFNKNTKYFSCNNVVDETHYPPLIPSGRYKIELIGFTKTSTILKVNTFLNIYRTLKPGQSG